MLVVGRCSFKDTRIQATRLAAESLSCFGQGVVPCLVTLVVAMIRWAEEMVAWKSVFEYQKCLYLTKEIKHVSTCGVMSAVSRVPDAFLRYHCILSAESENHGASVLQLSPTPAEMMFLRKAR